MITSLLFFQQQIEAYMQGKIITFSVQCDLHQGSLFAQKVWQSLMDCALWYNNQLCAAC